MRYRLCIALWGVSVALLTSAVGLQAQERREAPKEMPKIPPPDAQAAQVPPGYRVEVAVQDLTYPTSVEFDAAGNMYVAEGGYAYGDPVAPARVLRFAPTGAMEIAAGQLSGPVTDLLWHNGQLYISQRGKISVLESGGMVRDLVTGLPSLGDHHNNQMTVGPDGKIYFGQGTATNSGVVGMDNFVGGWLPKHPDFYDRPANAIQIRGHEFTTPNPLTLKAAETTKTSAFHPFGRNAPDGDRVPGVVKASGTILRMNPDGSGLEVYAWGLRNPFGVMWGPDGKLYASENGFDVRGSRPIANDWDDLYVIRQGAWYGWPDFAAGIPVTDARFRPEDGPAPQFLMQEHPPVEKPLLTLPKHAGVAKLDFSQSARFGYAGQIFLAEVGDMAPMTGKVEQPHGFRVVRIDPASQRVETFFHVKERAEGPKGMEYVATPGPKRPVDVQFSPDGNALYVVDFGAMAMVPTALVPMPHPFPGSGVVWRITREGTAAMRPPAGLSVVARFPPAGRPGGSEPLTFWERMERIRRMVAELNAR